MFLNYIIEIDHLFTFHFVVYKNHYYNINKFLLLNTQTCLRTQNFVSGS